MLKLPSQVEIDYQPYGHFILGRLTEGSYNGHATIIGIVQSGTETARLFQYTHTKSIAGEERTIYGVQQWELDRGHLVRVAG